MNLGPRRPIQGLSAVVGLALVGISAALLVWARPRAVDGRELLESTFDVGEMPFGYRVARSSRLPTGERTVVLEPPVLEEEPPAASAPEQAKTPEAASQPAAKDAPAKPRFDWSKVPLGESDRAPRQVFLVWYPESTAEASLKRQFQGIEWREARHLEAEGGLVAVDAGKLPWSGFDADFVHLRLCEPGGTFRDTMRVNLSAPGIRCALHALWSRGLPASKERVKEFLKAFVPKAVTDAREG